MLALSFEWGSTTSSWYAELALRRRVKKSAIGSAIVMVTCQPLPPWFPFFPGPGGGFRACGGMDVVLVLPAGLVHAGELAAVGHLPQADAAEAELAEDRAQPAAPLAARVAPHLELRLLRG